MDLAICIAITATAKSPRICLLFAAYGPRILLFLAAKNLHPYIMTTHLIFFQRFDKLFACSQQRYARSRMFFMIEVHILPRVVDSVQDLFHVHLFHRLLDDIFHLVFELVKIE